MKPSKVFKNNFGHKPITIRPVNIFKNGRKPITARPSIFFPKLVLRPIKIGPSNLLQLLGLEGH